MQTTKFVKQPVAVSVIVEKDGSPGNFYGRTVTPIKLTE